MFRSIILSIFFIAFLVSCSNENANTPQSMPTPEVDVSTPIEAVITQWDEYTGRFAAIESVELRARVSGYLEKVNFKDGQMVNKGDVLFVIDQRPFEIAIRSAQSRFDLAKKELERGRDLRKKSSISQEEVDRRLNEFEAAKANLESAQLDLTFTEVKSPVSGLVSRDFVNVGNLVNGSASNATLLTTVVAIDPIHFYFDAGESALLKYLRLSQNDEREHSRTVANPVQIKLQDETDFVHKGVMDFVDNQIDQNTGTIQGRAILDNKDGFLLPGMFGRMRLLGRENFRTLLIPESIVGTDQSRKFVYIVTPDNTIDRKFIELGALHTRELRVVESGLQANDKLVVNGLMKIRPGAKVNPNEVNIAQQYPLN